VQKLNKKKLIRKIRKRETERESFIEGTQKAYLTPKLANFEGPRFPCFREQCKSAQNEIFESLMSHCAGPHHFPPPDHLTYSINDP
jgi:hypothetical protein